MKNNTRITDRLSIATLNWETIHISTDIIRNYLSVNNCGIVYLQETRPLMITFGIVIRWQYYIGVERSGI